MQEKISNIKALAINDINLAKDLKELFDVKVKYLGKNGSVTELMKGMKDIPKEDRPQFGKVVNDLRVEIENEFNAREVVLKEEERLKTFL